MHRRAGHVLRIRAQRDKGMVNELLTAWCNIQMFTEHRSEQRCRAGVGVGRRQICDVSPVRVGTGWGE